MKNLMGLHSAVPGLPGAEWNEKYMPKRTVSPPTGEVVTEFKVRVCAEHQYPVGLISEGSREPFVCLLKFHRLEIEQTTCIESSLRPLKELMAIK